MDVGIVIRGKFYNAECIQVEGCHTPFLHVIYRPPIREWVPCVKSGVKYSNEGSWSPYLTMSSVAQYDTSLTMCF